LIIFYFLKVPIYYSTEANGCCLFQKVRFSQTNRTKFNILYSFQKSVR